MRSVLWAEAAEREPHNATASTADLKSLHRKRRVPFRDFRSVSGTRINKFASAHDFPKFVKAGAAMEHELRKVGTRSAKRRIFIALLLHLQKTKGLAGTSRLYQPRKHRGLAPRGRTPQPVAPVPVKIPRRSEGSRRRAEAPPCDDRRSDVRLRRPQVAGLQVCNARSQRDNAY